MAGKSRKSKVEVPPGVRSTAAIFRGSEAKTKEQEKEVVEGDTKGKEDDVSVSAFDENDPDSYGFPFNYIFKLQDFFNEHMTFCMFIQLLVHAFLLEVYYLGRDNFDLKDDEVTVLFNAAAILCGTTFTYLSTSRKFRENPTVFKKPSLPEFSYIHAYLIPLYLSSLHKSSFFVINLSLNYFLMENLNVVLQFSLSFIFFQFYAENATTNTSLISFMLSSFTYVFLKRVIEHINEGKETEEKITETSSDEERDDSETSHTQFKTLGKAEVHLLTVLLVNLLLNIPKLSEFTLPLYIFQKLILSLCVGLMVTHPIYSFFKDNLNSVLSLIILALFSGVFYVLVDYQLKPVLNNQAPLVWIYEFLTESTHRLNLFKIWGTILAITIPIAFFTAEKFSLDIRRKIWHLMLMALITPTLQSETLFTLISLLGTAFIFICIEILRFNKFTFLGSWLNFSLKKFQDFKDLKGPLNLSYLYLIVGCTLPMIIDYCIEQEVTIKSFMGLAALGLGDSLASLVGKRLGTIKWRGSSKSIQGTLAFVISTFAALVVVDKYLLKVKIVNWENVFIAVFLSGVLEGVVDDLNDNFVVPMFMVTSYEILNTTYVL